jgi:Protein of unknown function (DUF2799)
MTRKAITLLAAAPFFLLLGSCATISKKSCVRDSWYDIGMRGALQNADHADHISDVSSICGKIGIVVDEEQYESGFAEGVRRFCEPGNGYAWGLKGNSYNGICPNQAFNAAYGDGLRIYKVEQRRSAINDRLESIRSRLGAIDKQLDEVALTDELKRKLGREYDALLRERADLLQEQRSLPPI